MTYFSFFKSESLLLWRHKQDTLNALLFFVIVVTLFPLGIDATPDFLTVSAGGIIWCATSLAVLMSISRMYREDYEDGSLEQWLVSGLYLPFLILLKVTVQWLFMIAPLLLILPIVGGMLYLSEESFWVLVATLLLGSPSLFLIGSIGAALTVSLQQGAMLLMLLILPMYIPILIFATSAIKASEIGLPYLGSLAMLLAISLLSLVFAPFMAAASIKASVNE
ncbi:heme exporter protein CcmB [Marinomonas sp. C2222]|uniref:Heme exporter protein B n=1 Tax=Marinomonas sargassi TaxID=2984494 RepID=A0ABT2YNA4_9GAMM|nr:heme exporter protein CcmB [Marinomonas sargassi]MCV2401364.1 heme exporter protein CcmB [Marinomonas sargassi]